MLFMLTIAASAMAQAWRQNPVLLIREGKSSHISVDRTIVRDSSVENTYKVELLVTNHTVNGYITIYETVDSSIEIIDRGSCPCLASIDSTHLKFKWLYLPKGKALTLSYTIEVPNGMAPNEHLTGGVLYHQTQDKPTTGLFVRSPRYLSTAPAKSESGAEPTEKRGLRRKKKVVLPPL